MSQTIADRQAFDGALDSNEWVLIDFWAAWCGPCKTMGPIFDSIADEHSTDLFAAKVNVDECGQLAADFSIRGVPTLALLHNGEVASQLVGAHPKSVVDKWLNDHMQLRAA